MNGERPQAAREDVHYLSNVNPGYDPTGVLTFQISLPPGRANAHLRAVAESLVERIQSLPAVRAVGYAESLPMTRVSARFESLRTTPEARGARWSPGAPITPETPDTRFVSRDFLTAMAIPLIAGRTFGDNDRAGQPQAGRGARARRPGGYGTLR